MYPPPLFPTDINVWRVIIADPGMARMPTGDQAVARRDTHRVGRVTIRETHSLAGHLIDTWCLNQLLPIASQPRVAKIIGENQDDVGIGGLPRVGSVDRGQRSQQQ